MPHICPQEVALALLAIPAVKWLWDCCVRCCRKGHDHK